MTLDLSKIDLSNEIKTVSNKVAENAARTKEARDAAMKSEPFLLLLIQSIAAEYLSDLATATTFPSTIRVSATPVLSRLVSASGKLPDNKANRAVREAVKALTIDDFQIVIARLSGAEIDPTDADWMKRTEPSIGDHVGFYKRGRGIQITLNPSVVSALGLPVSGSSELPEEPGEE